MPAAGVPSSPRRVVLGISGASGAAYALRTLRLLLQANREVHLVVTDFGRRLLAEESGLPRLAPEELAGDQDPSRLIIHPSKDVGAVIASGSFLHDGMLIVPCASSSLGAIASGVGDTLLTRAAAVCLKERRRLILCHRETPLSLIDIENMRTLTLAGAIICPANPGFYLHPTKVEDLVDFVAARLLDLLGVGHDLAVRYGEAPLAAPGGAAE